MCRDMRDCVAPSCRISSQTQCSRPSQSSRIAASRVGSARAVRICTASMCYTPLMRISANMDPSGLLNKEILAGIGLQLRS